jgi:hypothetical protein
MTKKVVGVFVRFIAASSGLPRIQSNKKKKQGRFRNGHGLCSRGHTIEANFNIQLGESYNGLGDDKKNSIFRPINY